MTASAALKPKSATARLSHNLNGQRLGRKGRDTRARILAALHTLLAEPRETPLTLSAVAREASLGMTALYTYFSDLTELMLAAMEPVMAEAETAYVAQLRTHWPDETLDQHCYDYVKSFYAFWERHTQLLHWRNTLADSRDERMAAHRMQSASPVIQLFVDQMGHDSDTVGTPAFGMATVLYVGIERIVTVATDLDMRNVLKGNFLQHIDHYLQSEARLLAFGIREYRAMAVAA